jgi:hypothetical protein
LRDDLFPDPANPERTTTRARVQMSLEALSFNCHSFGRRCRTTFVCSPGATHFSVTAPATVTAGMAINLSVNALDASNNVAASYSGTAHFTSTDPKARLPANSTLTNGTATFSATMKTAGSQTITVTDAATASTSAGR